MLTKTVDIDFLGDAAQVQELAAALGYDRRILDRSDPTPNTAILVDDSGVVVADFLAYVAGLNETDIVRRRLPIMTPCRQRVPWWVALPWAILGLAISFWTPSASAGERVPKPPDAPKTRLETWFYYQENADGSGQYKLTQKVYLPLGASGGWRFTGRVDVPFLYTNKEGSGNPDGDWESHIGDSLTEFYATTPPVAPHLTLGGSLRLVWPTGGQPPFGAEQYQWAPSLYLDYRVPDLGYGMTLHPLARYFMSYHAASADAAKIRKLELYPTVTFDLPERWFIVLYPENPIVYNEITGQWFVPFEAMAGKDLSERLHLGFGGAVKLGGNDPQYRYLLEARVDWRF